MQALHQKILSMNRTRRQSAIKTKLLLSLAGLLCLAPSLFAQVVTEALQINPEQRDYHYFRSSEIAKRGFLQKNTSSDTLPIPFFDDFSRPDLSWAPSRFWYGYAIRSIHFLSASEARAYGDKGISIRTRNRGSIWEKNPVGDNPDFRSVTFPEPSVAFTCGSRGWLAVSNDSGRTWTSLSSPAPAGMRLDKIVFFTPQLGMLADSAGNLYRTADGGQSWSVPVISEGPALRVRALAFVNGGRVVAAGDSSRTAFSNDAGLTFTVTDQVFGRKRHFRNIHFADGFFGLAIGDSGMVFKTLNSGSSWFPLPLLSNETLFDAAVNPANKKLCWVTGSSGALFYSQNGGDNWARIRSGTTENLLSIALINEFRGWIGTDGGRLHQVIFDPLRPYSRNWEPGSGVYVNNTFSPNPPSLGVATFDGISNRGEPYYKKVNTTDPDEKPGPCDTLTSASIDLQDFSNVPLYLSFYYQPGTGAIELIPDPDDSLVLQFKGKSGLWHSIWNVRGEGDSIRNSPFRYVSVTVPDSLKFRGSRFRFMNFGNQQGSFDLWNLDYIRLDPEHDASDSLARDYTLSAIPGPLLKSYSALPLEQFDFAVRNNLPIFRESVSATATNLNPGVTNLEGSFFVKRIIPDSVQNMGSLPSASISGLENPFGTGIFSRPLRVETSNFRSLISTNQYATFEYGIGLSPNPVSNLYTGNDTISQKLNISTIMAYDDGSAELSRGVGQTGSIGVVKYYLPVSDTITDIQLFFVRNSANFLQTLSFALLVYDSLNVAANFAADPPLIRRQFILPPADSVNKFLMFSLRDDETLQKRILQGGRSFYIGWQQGLIDNKNEVRIGCDINTTTPSVFFYKTGGEWKAWNTDSLTLMIRPVFGPEYITSVKNKILQPESPFFPNPASDGFRNRRDFTRLQIQDLAGRQVFGLERGSAGELIRPGLASGLYFLRWLEDGKRPVVQKIRID
jgi:photosystem II stability/assembly factor-like uncharacterized protein